MNDDEMALIAEGLLLAAAKPLSVGTMSSLIGVPAEQILRALGELEKIYENRYVRLEKTAQGYCFRTSNEMTPYLQRLFNIRPPRLSQATLETLAIIAYRQPVTRGDIEAMRGTTLNMQAMRNLFERQWIKVSGHREVPGRPELLVTTQQFLADFKLQSLESLPDLPMPMLPHIVEAQCGLASDQAALTASNDVAFPQVACEIKE